MSFRINAGTVAKCGRRRVLPNRALNSALRTACGATKLKAPRQSGFSSKNKIPRTRSASEIQPQYCLPVLNFTPNPQRYNGSICASAPPCVPSTMPVRTKQTRVLAFSAAASQRRHKRAAKLPTGGLCSSMICSPQSP